MEKRRSLLEDLHKENHSGFAGLFKSVWEEGYYWDTMWKDCLSVTNSCKECKFFNVSRGGFHPMRTILAEKPMDHVVMDFIGPLTASERGYTHVLLLVDVHTQFIWLVPMIEKTAVEVAYELVKIFAGFGVPKILQSDNEPSFVGGVCWGVENVVEKVDQS